MKLPDSLLAIVFLAAALTMAAPAAFPEPPKSRAEALAALKNADTATRAEAVVWIANRGSMADAPLLHERLRDESAFVRSFAEQGLWLLWTRSGDAQIDGLIAKVATIKAEHAGARVAITEPVPDYLLQAAGLVIATPPAFAKAVEEGTDPPAAVVTANLATFTGPGQVAVLVENAQTEGPTTTQAEQAAAANGVPVVKVTETLPVGVTDYVTWMNRQVDALVAALDAR